MKLVTSIISCLLLLAATTSAFAQSHTKRTPEEMEKRATERFKKSDINGDGALTKEEFLARQEKHFNETDTDHNGKLTQQEMKAARAAKQEARKQHPAQKTK